MKTAIRSEKGQPQKAEDAFWNCNYQQAEEEFRKLLGTDLDNAQIQTAYAWLLIETQRFSEVESLLNGLKPIELVDARLMATVALSFFKLKQIDRAQILLNHALSMAPEDALVHFCIGACFLDVGQFEVAANHLHKAIELKPQEARAFNFLAVAYQQSYRMEDAEKAARRSVELRPHYEPAHANLLNILNHLNKLDEAKEHLKITKGLFPNGTRCRFVEAILLKREGRLEEAIKIFEAEQYPQEPALILKANCEQGLLYDRTGNTERAGKQFKKFNRLATEIFGITEAVKADYRNEIQACRQTFTSEWVAGWRPYQPKTAGNSPAFIFGFPRSGTTLLQHALDSHPDIYATEEIPAFPKIIEHLQSSGHYPACLAELGPEQIDHLREAYYTIQKNEPRWRDTKLLVDKYPLASVYLGAIHRLFPNAKLILSLRHPCDTILSGYMNLFEINRAMVHFYDLGDIVNLYCQTMDLLQQYQDVLGLKFHTVRYEDLVEDMEGHLRKTLSFLNMPWDDKVLSFNEKVMKQGDVRTASAEQVSEKLYNRSLYRWDAYKGNFEPFMEQLEPYIRRFGYSPDK